MQPDLGIYIHQNDRLELISYASSTAKSWSWFDVKRITFAKPSTALPRRFPASRLRRVLGNFSVNLSTFDNFTISPTNPQRFTSASFDFVSVSWQPYPAPDPPLSIQWLLLAQRTSTGAVSTVRAPLDNGNQRNRY
jgi:hypothetical protein